VAARGKIRQFPTAYELKAIKRAEGGEGVLPVARKLYYGAVHLIAMSRSAVFRSGWFRPTLACFKNPPVRFSTRTRKQSSPSGRPMLSAARGEAKRSASSSLASSSAKSGKRAPIGASAVTPSCLPRRCARSPRGEVRHPPGKSVPISPHLSLRRHTKISCAKIRDSQSASRWSLRARPLRKNNSLSFFRKL